MHIITTYTFTSFDSNVGSVDVEHERRGKSVCDTLYHGNESINTDINTR